MCTLIKSIAGYILSGLLQDKKRVPLLTMLWNRTDLFYGSGSDLGKVMDPVPDPDPIKQF